ncbi:hypothetical protein ACVWZK_006431 [Bradyrhizobium sp. GM0.4]
MEKATATIIALKAAELVSGDRQEAYGDVMLSLGRAALMWNALLTIAGKAPKQPINEHDVAQMMVSFKQARCYTGPLRLDNFIDEAGWSTIAGEAASRISD